MVTLGQSESSGKLELCDTRLSLLEADQAEGLPSWLSSQIVHKRSSNGLFSACHVFCTFVCLVNDLLFTVASKHSPKVLSEVLRVRARDVP